jgi:hypothetical protein
VTRADDSGMTLIELLLAMTLTVIIMTVIASSLILGLKSTQQVQDHLLDSHDAQLVSVYLPSDMLSAQPGALDINPATPTGCAGSPADPWSVFQLTWSDVALASTTWYRVAYRVVQNGTDWRLARFSCQAGTEGGLTSAAATKKLLVRNLQAATIGLPTLVEDQERMKLRLTDASGYAFTIAASRRLIALPDAPAPPRPRPVEISDVNMFDSNVNGRIDRVTVLFTGALPAPCRTGSFFELAAVPSAGSLGTVDFGAAGSATTTISITEGAGSPDTGVGDFRVRFTPTTGCDALAYDGPPVHDRAAPVLVGFDMAPTGGPQPGKAEPGDAFLVQFSEAVTGLPSTGTLTLTPGTPNRLSIPSFTTAPTSLGSALYLGGNKTASFPFALTATGTAPGAYSVTLGACSATPTNVCDQTLTNPTGGPMTVTPAATIQDSAGNAATVLPGAAAVPTNPLFLAF